MSTLAVRAQPNLPLELSQEKLILLEVLARQTGFLWSAHGRGDSSLGKIETVESPTFASSVAMHPRNGSTGSNGPCTSSLMSHGWVSLALSLFGAAFAVADVPPPAPGPCPSSPLPSPLLPCSSSSSSSSFFFFVNHAPKNLWMSPDVTLYKGHASCWGYHHSASRR